MNPQDKQRAKATFPKRAVITGGMPYGNKELHFGHIGGVFIHADIFARFLRDRIGPSNVMFVSGTDCYGSPIIEYHRQQVEAGLFSGTLEEFVAKNHQLQKETLEAYHVELNNFAASGLGAAKETHRQVSAWVFESLRANGHVKQLSTLQFYDTQKETFLQGRQVIGRCPIEGCRSEKGYADECDLGHQYMPQELISPKSSLSGTTPVLKKSCNWYLDLPAFQKQLEAWVTEMSERPATRPFVTQAIKEFLAPPAIHVIRKQADLYEELASTLPPHTKEEGRGKSFTLLFTSLHEREVASDMLQKAGIQIRNGKTLVPFRLSGDTEWGVPVPSVEGVRDSTFWVWPESLWAPISFTRDCLAQGGHTAEFSATTGKTADTTNSTASSIEPQSSSPPAQWQDWWCSQDSEVFQFIGEDNIYFYGPAQTAIFGGVSESAERALRSTHLIANHHLMFLDKKASSSGKVKPPMAKELLEYYTPDQLRAHFCSLGLHIRSVSFQPKPLNPKAPEKSADPVLKEGNLLSNVLNRAVRSCFYTAQKYCGGQIPEVDLDKSLVSEAEQAIAAYEEAMARVSLSEAFGVADNYIRGINKYWSAHIKEATESEDTPTITQVLANTFHMVRVAIALMHPIAPVGTEMVRAYLQLPETFWSWNTIEKPLWYFMDNPATHKLKFLEPRIDFFEKHPYQIASFN